ncbi:MAG: hypothetical protein D6B27_00615 [Gammaproteobacteria bacterium]|nr:MAG: hypothetical protein D6B27_00615 [Gammaproteobacteria bacterium]
MIVKINVKDLVKLFLLIGVCSFVGLHIFIPYKFVDGVRNLYKKDISFITITNTNEGNKFFIKSPNKIKTIVENLKNINSGKIAHALPVNAYVFEFVFSDGDSLLLRVVKYNNDSKNLYINEECKKGEICFFRGEAVLINGVSKFSSILSISGARVD